MSIRSVCRWLQPHQPTPWGSRLRSAAALQSGHCLRFHRVFSNSARPVQSSSTLAPLGVTAALKASTDPSIDVHPRIFDEFSLSDRVAIVSGGNRGLGLEMALALCEAGARAVYCVDLPVRASEEWRCTRDFARRMGSRLEYISADVRDQETIWARVAEVGDKEGRVDVCVAAAGILKAHTDCLEYPADEFREVMDVNTNGVLFTAQAAGRQMVRFERPGSIILIASMSGSITNRDHAWVSYNTSKSAVLQMARSMACELGPKGIRVNSLSPGHIYTSMTAEYLDKQPHLYDKWSSMNPMGRLGRPDELRGVVTWLASDASSFCTGSDIISTIMYLRCPPGIMYFARFGPHLSSSHLADVCIGRSHHTVRHAKYSNDSKPAVSENANGCEPIHELKPIPCLPEKVKGYPTPAITQEDLWKYITPLYSRNWQLQVNWKRVGLGKLFRFKTFDRAIEFLNEIANVARKENHHPSLTITPEKGTWTVHVDVHTHSALLASEGRVGSMVTLRDCRFAILTERVLRDM